MRTEAEIHADWEAINARRQELYQELEAVRAAGFIGKKYKSEHGLLTITGLGPHGALLGYVENYTVTPEDLCFVWAELTAEDAAKPTTSNS
jgi:hypothetical protein